MALTSPRAGRRPAAGEGDLTSRLIAAFRSMLADGTFAAGDRLPAERQLAKRFGVNRASLRQALTALEIMGVLVRRVGDGTYLSANGNLMLSAPLDFLILVDGISFQDLMEARIIVEPEMAARASQRATFEHLAALRGALKQMKDSGGDVAKLVQADLEFHAAVANASGNRTCQHMFAVIHKAMLHLIPLTSRVEAYRKKVAMHRSIYEAIYRRDEEKARALMLHHLTSTLELFLSEARKRPPVAALEEAPRRIGSNGRRIAPKSERTD